MKLKEITPKKLRCAVGPCPAVYASDRGTLVIVGKKVPKNDLSKLLPGKVASDEEGIELPKDFFPGLITD
jgi:hypothetical protein